MASQQREEDEMRRLGRVGLVVVGSALTTGLVLAGVEDRTNAVVFITLLLGGPAWCYAFAFASDEADFAGASRTRSDWLALLPWTFLLAPVVLPNIVLLAAFVRDSRADSGRSPLTWDRMRPGESARDHHWPDP